METPLPTTEILKESWKLTRKHIFIFAGITLIYLLIASFFQIATTLLAEKPFVTRVAVQIAYALFSTFFGAGLLRLSLQAADGQEPEFRNFLLTPKKFLIYFIAIIGLVIAVMMGFALLILPGIFLMVRFIYMPYLAIDSNLSLNDMFRKSWQMSEGYFWELFAWIILYFLIQTLGILFFLIGALITIPYSFLAMACLFRNQEAQHDRAGPETKLPLPTTFPDHKQQ